MENGDETLGIGTYDSHYEPTAAPVYERQSYQPGSAMDQYQQAAPVDWRESLPPQMLDSLGRFSSVEELGKAYMSASDMISRKVESYSEQDWKAYSAMTQQATGIPKEVSGYEFDLSPSGSTNFMQDDEIALLRERALDMGLTTTQAQKLYEFANESTGGVVERLTSMQKESHEWAESELKRAWGGDYQKKLNAVGKCLDTVLPQMTGADSAAVTQEMERLGCLSSPMMMNVLSEMGKFVQDSESKGYSHLTPMTAEMRLDQMRADPNIMNMMNNSRHPRSEELTAEFRALLKVKNGE